MSWNTMIDRQTIFLENAGEDEYNPILEGLPFEIVVYFNENVHTVSGLVGSTSPPTTAITFTVDPSNSMKYIYSGVAGTAPFNTVDALTNIVF